MARQTERTEIDGIGFEVTQLGMRKGRALFVRLAKALGPALAVALDGAPSLAALAQASAAPGAAPGGGAAGGLAPAVIKALEGLSDDDLAATMADLSEVTRYAPGGASSSKWPILDAANQEELFAGRILLLVRFLGFAIRVQFADFFGELAALGNAAAPAPGTPKP